MTYEKHPQYRIFSLGERVKSKVDANVQLPLADARSFTSRYILCFPLWTVLNLLLIRTLITPLFNHKFMCVLESHWLRNRGTAILVQYTSFENQKLDIQIAGLVSRVEMWHVSFPNFPFGSVPF